MLSLPLPTSRLHILLSGVLRVADIPRGPAAHLPAGVNSRADVGGAALREGFGVNKLAGRRGRMIHLESAFWWLCAMFFTVLEVYWYALLLDEL